MASNVKRRFGSFGRNLSKTLRKYGFRIFTDLLIAIGAVLMIVSLFFAGGNPGRTHVVMLVGLFFVLAASVVGLIFDALILSSKINKRSPRYRSALVNTFVMGAIFAVSLFGIIFTFASVL